MADVKKAHLDKVEEERRFKLSGQELSPTQFQLVNNAILMSGKDPEKLKKWFSDKAGFASLGKIDSSYYPGMMSKLKSMAMNDKPENNQNHVGLGGQYDARSEMYARMSGAA